MEKGVAYLAEVKVAVHPVENSAAQYKGKKYLQCLPDDMFDENDKPLFSTTYGEFNYSYMRLFNGDVGNEYFMNTTDYRLHKFTMGDRDWGITRYAICPEALTRLGERCVC